MGVVLGIDLGTSWFKLGIIDREGRLAGLGRIPLPAPEPGSARRELPVAWFREALADGIGRACRQAGVAPAAIRAVSYASQANSFLALDAGFRPLTPLILWSDERAQPVDPAAATLWARDDYLPTSGMNLQGPQLCAAKLCWLRARRPGLWGRIRHLMTISDYLTYSLTGEAAGDEATASLLGFWDVAGRRWWPEALDLLEVPAAWLSALRAPGSPVGSTGGEGAAALGLGRSAAFAVGSLDHHAAALGAGCGSLAPVSESTGTVLACLAETERYEPRAEYCLGAADREGRFFKLAFNENGASALQGYRDTRAPHLSIEELAALAGRAPPGCEGLVALPRADRFPALQGFRLEPAAGGAPSPAARRLERLLAAAPASPTAVPDALHGYFARAMMESTAASLRDLLRAIGGGGAKGIVATGGGARSDLWLQIKADLLGVEVLATGTPEPACYGAGMMAAVAAGWFVDRRGAAAAWVRARRRFRPGPAAGPATAGRRTPRHAEPHRPRPAEFRTPRRPPAGPGSSPGARGSGPSCSKPRQ